MISNIGSSTIPNQYEKVNPIQSSHTKAINQETENVKEIINNLNSRIKDFEYRSSHLQFAYHEQSNRTSVAIVDEETGEILKEIPSSKYLDLVGAMLEGAGLILNKKG